MACALPDVQHEMSCPVCFDPYSAERNNPKVLTCGHTICHECVKNLLERNQMFLTGISSMSQGLVKCPLCNCQTRVPANGLPTNYCLRDVLCKFAEMGPGNTDVYRTCISCQVRQRESTFWYCEQCVGENLGSPSWACPNCAIKYHNGHSLVDFETMKGRRERIQSQVKLERDLVVGELARVQQSSRQLAQLQENIGEVLHQNCTRQFDHIENQLAAGGALVLGWVGLEPLGQKASQIRAQLQDACQQSVQAQTQAQQVMEQCLQELLKQFQTWELDHEQDMASDTGAPSQQVPPKRRPGDNTNVFDPPRDPSTPRNTHLASRRPLPRVARRRTQQHNL